MIRLTPTQGKIVLAIMFAISIFVAVLRFRAYSALIALSKKEKCAKRKQ